MNYTGPKVKLSRKIGVPITPKAKKSKRTTPPGQHGGSKKRAKLSDYGKQLLEKQRLRLQYNISEKHMSNYYKEAARMTGNTGDILVQLIESRLDNLVVRAGLARSIYAARQYVVHGHVLVNGRKLNVPSYQVKVNDVISIKTASQKIEAIQEAVRTSGSPAYLEVSKADFSAKFLYVPPKEEIQVIVEMPLVVEFYSR